MKKSLLIILSLIFMNMSAHAVGVDCWEEYTEMYLPTTESKMQSVLGSSVTITRVKTEYRGINIQESYAKSGYGAYPSTYTDLKIAVMEPMIEKDTNKGYYYTLGGSSQTSGYQYLGPTFASKYKSLSYNYPFFGIAPSPVVVCADNSCETQAATSSRDDILYYNVYLYSGREFNDDATKISSLNGGWHGGYFAHTYCIENTNSGGGGGGSGASVNYIIKAN